jgi:hypothetical protein
VVFNPEAESDQFQVMFDGITQPHGVAVDTNGNIYIAESGSNHQVKIYFKKSDGSFFDPIVINETNNGGIQFQGPYAPIDVFAEIVFENENTGQYYIYTSELYVSKVRKFRLDISKDNGVVTVDNITSLSTIELNQLYGPLGIAAINVLDEDNVIHSYLYVTEYGVGMLKYKLSPETIDSDLHEYTLLKRREFLPPPYPNSYPADIAFDSQGNFYVTEHPGVYVNKYDSDLNFIAKWTCTINDISMHEPYGVVVDDNDNIFIADTGNNRILKFVPSPIDFDKDGIPDNEDNCLATPNGPDLGTCTNENAGENCMSNDDCGTGAFCSMNQEDFDNDEIGNVCDLCTDQDEDEYGREGLNNSACTYPEYDCDDTNPEVNPGAIEVCDDGIDNDCDGKEDVSPVIDSITGTIEPIPLGQSAAVSVEFTDLNEDDAHTATFDWGDGTDPSIVNVEVGIRSVEDTYTYTQAGVYAATVTVSDGYCEDSSATYEYVVVYDPDGGFVTGGGWIDSPEGAYAPDPTLTGKANFGFVSKYKKGATVPTGETEFQFKVADLNFHSDVYQWLVIAGARAQYKGTGTINGEGNYGFMLTSIDEKLTPSTDVDMFRIKIWDKDNGDVIVYDNQMSTDDDAELTTGIGGGSIVIHKSK